jgi:3-hydroxyisobutyrate dehydrogenase-like beta-hydroxyacid dehydrogenase
MRIAFIGLGRMGMPMAANLLKANHTLSVWNRTAARAAKLQAQAARVATSPSEAAAGADLLITMLADDPAVEQVIFGNGALAQLPASAVHASMSTISPALSRRLAEAHADAGQGYVAAPVFGRPEAAAAAKLWVVASGPARQVERCRPAFEAIGQGVFVVGTQPEAANIVKLSGNFLLASTIEAIAEALTLVRKSGVEPGAFMAVMNALFRSPIVENYGKAMVEGRFEPAGFALKLGLKDLRLALAAADAAEVPMPLAGLLHDRFLTASARGLGEIDWAGVARVVAESAGLPD